MPAVLDSRSPLYQYYILNGHYVGDGTELPSGVPPAAFGNLQGLIAQLDYIQQQGFKAIWVNPLQDSDLVAGAGYGYDATDYVRINPVYGDEADMQALAAAAGERGLSLVLDMVLNHTSRRHTWFEASRNPHHPEHARFKDHYLWHKPIRIEPDRWRQAEQATIEEVGELGTVYRLQSVPFPTYNGEPTDRTMVVVQVPCFKPDGVTPERDAEGKPIYVTIEPMRDYDKPILNAKGEVIGHEWLMQDGAVIYPPNNYKPFFGETSWNYDPLRGECYLASFHPTMPDLNIANQDVQTALIDACKQWMERGFGGFRFDAFGWLGSDAWLANPQSHDAFEVAARTSNPPAEAPAGERSAFSFMSVGGQQRTHDFGSQIGQEFWLRLVAELRQYAQESGKDEPGFLFENGDVLSHWRTMYPQFAAGAAEDGANVYGYTSAFDRVHSPADMRRTVELNLAAFPEGKGISWTLDNHDTTRFISRMGWDENPDAYKLALTFFSHLPGHLCVYNGSELGLPNPALAEIGHGQDVYGYIGRLTSPDMQAKTHDAARAAIPYQQQPDGVGDNGNQRMFATPTRHRERAVEVQQKDFRSVLRHFRDAMQVRSANAILHQTGAMEFYDVPPELGSDVLVYKRQMRDPLTGEWSAGKLFVANFTGREIALDVSRLLPLEERHLLVGGSQLVVPAYHMAERPMLPPDVMTGLAAKSGLHDASVPDGCVQEGVRIAAGVTQHASHGL